MQGAFTFRKPQYVFPIGQSFYLKQLKCRRITPLCNSMDLFGIIGVRAELPAKLTLRRQKILHMFQNHVGRRLLKIAAPFTALVCLALTARAQDNDVRKLKELSIEDLMNIEVTSVSKVPQRLSQVASAIQVITHDDILRSGATNIPEALRLSPNLQVAQVNSSAWIISARGFNTVFANKLLVLIDGRTVYTPLFGGVLWELQGVLLEDVDRIEVISGPGAALWGANAVNGVINIITRKSQESQGLYASATAGDFLKTAFAARYGNHIGEKFFYKIYAQTADRKDTPLADDGWYRDQIGLRIDMPIDEKNNITIQGDAYVGDKNSLPSKSRFDGQNILARWTHTVSDKSEFILQTYYDRYWRDDPGTADQLSTYDLDFQHRVNIKKIHTLLYGAGYRVVHDNVINRNGFAGLVPADRVMPLYSAFVQDEVSLGEKVKVTLGSKFLHNVFSGFEIQPSVRGAWSVSANSTVWAAVSRAIRAPSRFDVDYRLPIQPQPPTSPSVIGTTDFKSEVLHAFELGYRIQSNQKLSLSLATFYNDYDDVYSVELRQGTQTYVIQNGSAGKTWGAELSGFYQILKPWRLRGGFTYFAKDLHAKDGRDHDPSYLSNDAKHQVVLQSMLDLPLHFKLDVVGRYLDYIPASFATPRIPDYTTFDVRLAWSFKQFDIAVIGQNLAARHHLEFGTITAPRSAYAKIICRF